MANYGFARIGRRLYGCTHGRRLQCKVPLLVQSGYVGGCPLAVEPSVITRRDIRLAAPTAAGLLLSPEGSVVLCATHSKSCSAVSRCHLRLWRDHAKSHNAARSCSAKPGISLIRVSIASNATRERISPLTSLCALTRPIVSPFLGWSHVPDRKRYHRISSAETDPGQGHRNMHGIPAQSDGGSSTKSSTARSGSWRLALMKAPTLRPVCSSIVDTKRSSMLSCQI